MEKFRVVTLFMTAEKTPYTVHLFVLYLTLSFGFESCEVCLVLTNILTHYRKIDISTNLSVNTVVVIWALIW